MASAYEDAVRAVPHADDCAVRCGTSRPGWPKWPPRTDGLTYDHACTCDRDARIARGMEAGVLALDEPVFDTTLDAAFLAAFAEASR